MFLEDEVYFDIYIEVVGQKVFGVVLELFIVLLVGNESQLLLSYPHFLIEHPAFGELPPEPLLPFFEQLKGHVGVTLHRYGPLALFYVQCRRFIVLRRAEDQTLFRGQVHIIQHGILLLFGQVRLFVDFFTQIFHTVVFGSEKCL